MWQNLSAQSGQKWLSPLATSRRLRFCSSTSFSHMDTTTNGCSFMPSSHDTVAVVLPDSPKPQIGAPENYPSGPETCSAFLTNSSSSNAPLPLHLLWQNFWSATWLAGGHLWGMVLNSTNEMQVPDLPDQVGHAAWWHLSKGKKLDWTLSSESKWNSVGMLNVFALFFSLTLDGITEVAFTIDVCIQAH